MSSTTPDYPRLIADIGGTNARFALETARQQFEHIEVLPCADYDTIVDAAKEYLKRAGNPSVRNAAIAAEYSMFTVSDIPVVIVR